MILRPDVQTLLEDTRRGVFEIVGAEALDRVSRDQADVGILYKHLRLVVVDTGWGTKRSRQSGA